jgi:hypothetical protein
MRQLAESCVVFLLILAGLVFVAASLGKPAQPPARSEEEELLDRIHHHPWWKPEPTDRLSFDKHWYETMIEKAAHQESELVYIMNGIERDAYDAAWLWWLFEQNEPVEVRGATFDEFIAMASHSWNDNRFIVYIGPKPPGSHCDRLLVLRAILDGLEKNQAR